MFCNILAKPVCKALFLSLIEDVPKMTMCSMCSMCSLCVYCVRCVQCVQCIQCVQWVLNVYSIYMLNNSDFRVPKLNVFIIDWFNVDIYWIYFICNKGPKKNIIQKMILNMYCTMFYNISICIQWVFKLPTFNVSIFNMYTFNFINIPVIWPMQCKLT